jgi:hypothetical protein
MTERLVDLAIRLWQGDETAFAEIGKLARLTPNGDGSVTAVGPSGITCGIALGGDPVTQAVQLGFLFFGQLWPFAVPDLLPSVNRRWKAETQRRKESANV